MARNRKEKAKEERIKLRQPDRSGPTGKTLLDLANERDLFQQADWRQRELELARQRAEDDKLKLPPGAERFLEALLYSATLAVVHFSFDVLVMRQYGPEVKWDKAFHNAPRAFIVFLFLFYALHAHEPNATLVPGLPRRFQRPLRQLLFFGMSCVSGCALAYVTNSKGYLYNMKRSPPLGCLWLWAVWELDLAWALPSLAVTLFYMWMHGYGFR